MFGLRKTLGSILLLVIFLALASLATFFYNADQKQKEAITSNNLVQKGGAVLETLIGASETVADANLQKNVGFGKTIADYVANTDWQKILLGQTTSTSSDSTTDEEITEEENAIILDNTGENADLRLGDRPDLGLAENTIPETNAESSNSEKQPGFWSKFVDLVKEEWAASQESEAEVEGADKPKESAEAETLAGGENSLNYKKTETGAEVIFQSKSGQEYKLPLPFKFLTKF